jgi:hypothetical protein
LIEHGAVVGQRTLMFPQALVPMHCTSHAPVSGHRTSRLPQDETPLHSTRHFMPGGQSKRRPPHDDTPLQRMRHASSTQPPVQTSGHFSGGIVLALGHIGGAVSVDAVSVDVVSGLTVSTSSSGVVSSAVAVSALLLVDESAEPCGPSKTEAASDPPQPAAARSKQRTARMR